jgi:hypothetical protein
MPTAGRTRLRTQVDYLISTPIDVRVAGNKKVVRALDLGKPIVSEEFVSEAVARGRLPDPSAYLLSGDD